MKFSVRSKSGSDLSVRAHQSAGWKQRSVLARAAIEALETRRLLSVVTVNSTADTDTFDSALTLREAIEFVDGTLAYSSLSTQEQAQINLTQPLGTNDTIKFNIFGLGVQTINLTSDLTISKAVTIDGYTQPGASAATDAAAANILIAIDGGYPHGGALKITGDNVTLRGLAAGDTVGSVITVSGTNDTIAGDYIGVGADSSSFGGTGFGVSLIKGATDTLIGGTTAADRNIISDSNGGQISVDNGYDTTIEGNYIGTTVDGNAAFQTFVEYENNYGIQVTGNSSGTFIGGAAPGARNVISGNTLGGILIGDPGETGGAGNVQVKGNYIGTNAAGTAAVGNYSYGITLQGSVNNTIGGTTAAERNVISGNGNGGILLTGAVGDSIYVQGNYIGTNAAGTAAIPNQGAGIAVTASNFTIGGTDAGDGNLISGNKLYGIEFNAQVGGPLTNELVEGNYIGTDATGTVAVPNSDNGIEVLGTVTTGEPDTSTQITIGGVTAAARNVISGNSYYGINFDQVSGDNVVEGNYIGVNAAGTAALGNGQIGVYINGGTYGQATDVVVGGIVPGAGNVISGNSSAGVLVFGDDNTIQGNLIGVLADGTTTAGNGRGVGIYGASNNIVGGSLAGANVIANSQTDGVVVADTFGGGDDYASQDGVRFNSIFNSGQLGINLVIQSPGVNQPPVTPNDPGDTDFGGNDFQNFPVLSTATSDGKSVTVTGTLNSAANRTYLVDVYANAVANALGYGEGKQYLGTVTVTTGSDGNATFTSTFNAALGGNTYISSTATTNGAIGETSEFGPTIQATTAAIINPPTANAQPVAVIENTATAITLTGSDPNSPPQPLTYTVTTSPTHGTLSGTAPNLTYTPANGYTGADSFQFTDNNGTKSSTPATVTINVTAAAPSGSLAGSSTTAASSYNLTTLGTSDWAAYGVNGVTGAFDHKATGGSQISNITTVGSGSFGGYKDDTGNRTLSWTDGTPLSSDANDTGFAWVNNGLNAGYRFTAPRRQHHTNAVYLSRRLLQQRDADGASVQ